VAVTRPDSVVPPISATPEASRDTASVAGLIAVVNGSHRFSPIVRILSNVPANDFITGVRAAFIGPPISPRIVEIEFFSVWNAA